jgi:hypothetical protein
VLNSRDISLLRDDVEANCRKWLELCRDAGLDVLVTNTVRDKEYQEYLYAQGRTRPGSIVTNSKTPTFHSDTAGLAFDFCKNIKGHEYDDNAFFVKAAAIAKGMGFSWGGDWKSFVDMPHIQWDNGGEWTSAMIRAGKLPPQMPLCGEENNEEAEEVRYNTIEELPSWAKETIEKLVTKGYLKGDGNGLDLSHDMVRMLVINDRAGLYDRG